MWVDRGAGGLDTPLKKYLNIGFLSNTGPDPLENHSYKARIKCCVMIGPPAKRHLNGA